jgi:hypothetical protein
MPRLIRRRGQEEMNSRHRFIAWASVGFSLIKESTKVVKLSVNGTGRAFHQARTPGNVSHQAVASDQRFQTSSGIASFFDA